MGRPFLGERDPLERRADAGVRRRDRQVPSIVLNKHIITTAAARLGLPDITTTSGPVSCEQLARLQQLLGLDLAVLTQVIYEPEELSAAG